MTRIVLSFVLGVALTSVAGTANAGPIITCNPQSFDYRVIGSQMVPNQSGPPLVISMSGPNRLATGGLGLSPLAQQTVFNFVPSPPTSDWCVGNPFLIGFLGIHNGVTLPGTAVESVTLRVGLNFDLGEETFSSLETFTLQYINTNNRIPITDLGNQDYVTIFGEGFSVPVQSYPEFKNTFGIRETGDQIVELRGLIRSRVIASSFAPPSFGAEISTLGLPPEYEFVFLGFSEPSDPEVFFGNLTELQPVPEPATLTLLGVGLAGIAARRWRQRS